MKDASDQFMEFLRNFYQVFPEYQTEDVSACFLCVQLSHLTFWQTYLGGESFAGQWIPFFGKALGEYKLLSTS